MLRNFFVRITFDLIICYIVLEYVEDIDPYLMAFLLFAQKGGKLSIVKT